MKSFILIALIIISASCTHTSQRSPSSFSDRHYIDRWKEESVRYILSHEPKKFGEYKDLIQDEEKLYRLLGEIDKGEHRLVYSQVTGREPYYKDQFDLRNVEQISYDEWKELRHEVAQTYAKGEYVFRMGSDFYSLSGLKMNIKNLNYRIALIANNFVPGIDQEELALSVFNRKVLYPVEGDKVIVLPSGRLADSRDFASLMRDFKAQVGPEIQISFIDLLNYNFKGPSLNTGDFNIYRNEKYHSFLADEKLDDSKSACKTRFYYRSLTQRKDAKIFMKTLIEHKANLMDVLNLTNNEYDELMILSLGVLAVESKMGQSLKYKIKQDIRFGDFNLGQWAIKLIKELKGRTDENSRGLTQIKDIGPLLEDTQYSYLENSDLDNPENAAIATMFVLKEKLGYLRHFSKKHENITSDNWADYLYYFYQGASSQITRGIATPPLNLRIQKILEVREDTMVFTQCN